MYNITIHDVRVFTEVLLRRCEEIAPNDFILADDLDVFIVQLPFPLVQFEEIKYIFGAPPHRVFMDAIRVSWNGVHAAGLPVDFLRFHLSGKSLNSDTRVKLRG